MDPTNDLPRLGGLLSYLMRESPVPQADLEPAVPQQQQQQAAGLPLLPAASPRVSLPPPLHAPKSDAATARCEPPPVTAAHHISCRCKICSHSCFHLCPYCLHPRVALCQAVTTPGCSCGAAPPLADDLLVPRGRHHAPGQCGRWRRGEAG